MTDLELQLATAQSELKGVYRERAHLVALLASMYPSSYKESDPDTPGWSVLTVTLPTGQASWHIAPEDDDLFCDAVRQADAIEWDGHSTDEKYERIDAYTQANYEGRGSVVPLQVPAEAKETAAPRKRAAKKTAAPKEA